MTHYKLVALDMDGTLLNEEKTISEPNRQAIQSALAAGVTVMFSTGRGIQSALPYAEELKLHTPLVTVNGSEVWKTPYELLQRQLINSDWIGQMHELAVRYDTWFWAYSVEGIFNKDKWTEQIDARQWLKFGYYMEDKGILREIRSTLEMWDTLEITNSHPFNLEINPKGVSKASGLTEVCKLLGIQMSEVIAMGDSLNDMTMIRAAGLGVAMGNAQEEVKRAADVVTVSNDEHGVAAIINDYVLKG